MPRLVVPVLTSPDGDVEGPDKDRSPMPFQDAFTTHNRELLPRAGTRSDGWKLSVGPRAGLQLLEATVLEDSELVELRYAATMSDPDTRRGESRHDR